MRYATALSALALGCAACGSSSTTPGQVERYAQENHIPGIGLAVSQGGVEDETAFYGLADLENEVAVTRDSVFRVASLTKVFTAVGVMLLKDEGKLDTSDPLARYVDFPRGDEVTLKMLLQHTSGVLEFLDVQAFADTQARAWTPQEILALVEGQPYQFEPGTSAQYTNTNFLLLGLVLEKVSGLGYAEFIRTRVAEPLGMSATSVGVDDGLIAHRVSGYTWDGAYENAEWVSVVAPFATGDILSRPVDLLRLASALRKGRSPLLSDAAIEEMTSPTYLKDGSLFTDPKKPGYATSFGYGLELRRPDGSDRWIVTKGGSLPGFKSMLMYFPASDTAVVADGNGDADLFDLCRQVADAHGATP